MFFCFFFFHIRIGANDDEVAFLGEAGGRTVDADDAGIFLSFDGVGGEAFAVVDVQDVHLFVGEDSSGVQKGTVNRDGSFVMKIALGHRGAVNFAFEHPDIHSVVRNIECMGQVKRRYYD